ncbi:DUF6527 family protein [Sphingomonas sp. TX0543]|uniref:DUF6527 family protein n=1 Tax=Sphingomonas sp. TX0543 TaxID=3399682 RepID=UPI003AFAE92B
MLLDNVKPRWSLSVDRLGLPTLHPSVWARDGCRSHFWLVGGKVRWCRDLEEDGQPQRRSSRRRRFGI